MYTWVDNSLLIPRATRMMMYVAVTVKIHESPLRPPIWLVMYIKLVLLAVWTPIFAGHSLLKFSMSFEALRVRRATIMSLSLGIHLAKLKYIRPLSTLNIYLIYIKVDSPHSGLNKV